MNTERTTIESSINPRLWLWVTGIIAAFLIGFGVGSLGDDAVPQVMIWVVQQVVSGS